MNKQIIKDMMVLTNAVMRVRELHKQTGIWCGGCSTDDELTVRYPCPTIKALDGYSEQV